ncbi:uncharacterized protein [Brachyistius frenatus]|uniref:uncharacterized protein isoform X1 n=2 Tax=Brachyistius frenatus TaxID=100188 RepID=UPI0037E8A2DB
MWARMCCFVVAMDGVLARAAALCVCKLACSFLFLPSLAASYSPVSFCCCCLLIVTDFLVAVFLSFLCIFEPWLTELNPSGDVIALRFLLFLSHIYGAVLFLTIPLIAVETLIRCLGHQAALAHRKQSHAVGTDGQHCNVGKVNVGDEDEEEEEGSNSSDEDKDKRVSHVVGYLCCLSVWFIVTVDVRWQWKLEEVWTAACLHTTNSLVSCLPNLLSDMPHAVNLCWCMAFLFLLLLLLTGLQRRYGAPAPTERTHRQRPEVYSKGNGCRRDLIPESSAPFKPVNPGTSVSELVLCVDPEKTESSCTVHRAYSWNSVQMSTRHHGDFVLISPECLSGKRGGQEHERTKRGIPLTFISEEDVDSRHSSQCGWPQWGFPCLRVNVMIGFVSALSIFVLPFHLSVNILLIRTIETLLELCVKSLVLSAADTRDTSNPNIERLV